MVHVDIGSETRSPDRLVAEHLRRISGKEFQSENVDKLAESCFFQMYWNVASI